MKAETASMLKGVKTSPQRMVPAEGSALRRLYDLFASNRGTILSLGKQNSRVIADLRDYYGLDIRCLKRGKWSLVGEWNGPNYVDYIAEKANKIKDP